MQGDVKVRDWVKGSFGWRNGETFLRRRHVGGSDRKEPAMGKLRR
jgi:hypothetical protein